MSQRFVCCLLLAVVLAIPLRWAHAEEVVNRVVAIVDEDVITSLDLDRAIRRLKMDMARMEAMQQGGRGAAHPGPAHGPGADDR